ncbi:MAG: cupin domain-containing protein [Vicinamibacterales bacterium]
MLSPTLHKGPSEYAIGAKIRSLRLKKKMGLVVLGKHTGLSPTLLSKIERDRLFPTLPTLLRIALVFSVDLEFFFAGAREKPVVAVVRKADRVRLPQREGSGSAYKFESLDYPVSERKFDSYYADVLPVSRAALRLHDHPGVELICALQGTLSVHIGGEEHTLEARDSMYFDSSVPHGYKRKGTPACSAIIVTG